MSIKSKFTILKSGLSVLVFTALAASITLASSHNETSRPLNTLNSSAHSLADLVNTITSIVVALAFLYFFYNLATYILSVDTNDKTVAAARMGWSALAIFFIVSIWGIVAFIGKIIGVDPGATGPGNIALPTVSRR